MNSVVFRPVRSRGLKVQPSQRTRTTSRTEMGPPSYRISAIEDQKLYLRPRTGLKNLPVGDFLSP